MIRYRYRFTRGNASFAGLCLPPEGRTVGEVRFDPGLGLGLYCLDESGCGGRGHAEDTKCHVEKNRKEA